MPDNPAGIGPKGRAVLNARAKPVPRVRGGLPRMDESKADVSEGGEGHEIPSRPIEWYERGNPAGMGEGSASHPWSPPAPPEGVDSGRGMTREDLHKLHEENPEYYDEPFTKPVIGAPTYQEGGPVGGPVPSASQPAEVQQIVRNIIEKYPLLGGHDWSVIDSRGKSPAGDDRKLEFYSADEPDSPTPGRPTIEVFDPSLQGPALEKAIFGDMLHQLPYVDETWNAHRENFRSSITPEQAQIDQRAYESSGDDRPYDDWFERSRLDAYVRGHLAPDENDEWREHYTPEQRNILTGMEDHLQQGRRYRAGGAVRVEDDPEEIEDDDKARRALQHRGYRPRVNDEPARAWREPEDTTGQDERYPDGSPRHVPHNDSGRWYAGGGLIAPAPAPRNRRPLIIGRPTSSGGIP